MLIIIRNIDSGIGGVTCSTVICLSLNGRNCNITGRDNYSCRLTLPTDSIEFHFRSSGRDCNSEIAGSLGSAYLENFAILYAIDGSNAVIISICAELVSKTDCIRIFCRSVVTVTFVAAIALVTAFTGSNM